MSLELETARFPSMLSIRSLETRGGEADACNRTQETHPCDEGDFSPWSLASVPALQGALDDVLRAGANLDGPRLDNSIDALQEQSLDSLYALLAAAGVNRDERLVLSLDKNGTLNVGEHPQRDAIVAALAAHPDVARKMRLMAALALTERGLDDLGLAGRIIEGKMSHENNLPDGERFFQACLKGCLSHFHLMRRN